VQTFGVDSLNQLTRVARNTNMTVAGTTTSHATSVTVNGGAAILYNDATFARTNVGLVNGNNTFTAIAQDTYGRQDTNTVTAYMPGTTTFVYDANGNLRTNGQEILVYDEENRLVTNYLAGSWKSEFVYDGLNRRRIQRDYAWSNGGWAKTNEMRLVYDGNLIIQHRDANNLPTLALTRGLDLSGSLQKAGGIGGLLAMTKNPGASSVHSYYHSDGNGNVTALISPNQMVVAKAVYDPYGGFISLYGPKVSDNPYWFSSKPIHTASGKYDFLYRWYTPNLQRWINRDPIHESGDKNLYRFVEDSPIGMIDGVGFGRIGPGYGVPGLPNGIVSSGDITPPPVHIGPFALGPLVPDHPAALSPSVLNPPVQRSNPDLRDPGLSPLGYEGLLQGAPHLIGTPMGPVMAELSALDILSAPGAGMAGEAIAELFPSKTLATQLADEVRGMSAATRPNTVAVVETPAGELIPGRNQGNIFNQEMQDFLKTLEPSDYSGQCAEVNAISEALNRGINLNGAEISVSHVRGLGTQGLKHGAPSPPCPACAAVLKRWGLTYVE
jgi:RHS repeat-associated protein